MGYCGLGMQRWISTLKPREFLGKRSKPDGGGVTSSFSRNINDFYHFNGYKMSTSRKRVYSSAYKSKLNKELQAENKKQNILLTVGIMVLIIACTALFLYLNSIYVFF